MSAVTAVRKFSVIYKKEVCKVLFIFHDGKGIIYGCANGDGSIVLIEHDDTAGVANIYD